MKHIFQYLDKEERLSSRKIRKVYLTLSEFGGLNEEHFLQHYKDASCGTRWQGTALEIQKVPCGPELEITRLEFT